MMKFFKQMVSKDNQKPIFRQYTHGELRIIAMRTRMIFEQIYRKQSIKITQADNQFKKVQASQGTIQQQYQILQQIGRKVIETETLKLYIEILRKIEAYAPQIMNTKGDVALMKQEIKWFQCILWYRKCKKLNSIEEFNTFCWNFFKGVDITMELNLKCELFQLYPGLEYLDDDMIIPLDYTVQKVIPHVSFQIQQDQLDEMKKINQGEIREKQQEQKRKKLEENPVFPLPINNNYNIQNSQNIPNPINTINQPQQLPSRSESVPVIPHNNFYPNPSYQSTKQYTKVNTQDDEFAVDPYSKIHPSNPNPHKDFKSNNLNLVDWQSFYKKQQNPYVNSSKAGLINPDYSISSSENQYDEKTLPYPPSGVVPVEDIRKHDSFFIDTLPHYASQTAESQMGFMKKPQTKADDNSFIRNIQNQFFDHGQTPQNHKKPIYPSTNFKEQDLLNEVTSSSNKIQKQPEVQGKKSLNKLFGFKFKSNLEQQNIIDPKPNNYGSSSQNYNDKNTDLSYSKSGPSEIDDILANMSDEVKQVKTSNQMKSDLDDILADLNLNSNSEEKINTHQNQSMKKKTQQSITFSIDDMMRNLDIDSNQNNFNQSPQNNDSQHLDEDIKSLIESHKQQIKRQSSKHSSEDNYNPYSKQSKPQHQNQNNQFTPYQYPDDQERFNDSKIKFSQQMELLDDYESRIHNKNDKQDLPQRQNQSNSQLNKANYLQQKQSQHQQFDYNSLQQDLFDSIKIIKNHFGQVLPQRDHANETNTKPLNQNTKKPYMVSIYARKQFMDGHKLAKHHSAQ